FLRRKLFSMKMGESESLEHHLLQFEKVLRDLKSVGAKMEEEDIVFQLLLSLPKSYEPIVTALETMKAEELTMEFVKGRLLDCDIKRKTNVVGELHEVPTSYSHGCTQQKEDCLLHLWIANIEITMQAKIDMTVQIKLNVDDHYMKTM